MSLKILGKPCLLGTALAFYLLDVRTTAEFMPCTICHNSLFYRFNFPKKGAYNNRQAAVGVAGLLFGAKAPADYWVTGLCVFLAKLNNTHRRVR